MYDESFNSGDIVCAKVKFTGLSYYYLFGKVIKITPHGRLHVKELETDLINVKKCDSGMGSIRTEVKPSDRGLNKVYKSNHGNYFKYQVEIYGKSAPILKWNHYDPGEIYVNYDDNGD